MKAKTVDLIEVLSTGILSEVHLKKEQKKWSFRVLQSKQVEEENLQMIDSVRATNVNRSDSTDFGWKFTWKLPKKRE